ncbi:MAG: NAD(P)/FAD-dependent oxidoreductase [Acidimicrobiales bacterium]|nr:NAD(P)/FAD-dependent oxidoreductase [Acidimicrobiales bacterium]
MTSAAAANRELDVVIVGAGFAGLYMLHRAHELGLQAEAIERGDGVGGTWYWNRYPGARCDVPSMEYSFGFDHDLEQEWEWTEKYATQSEILSYIEHIADRFNLRDDVTLSTTVESCRFDESSGRWSVATSDGIDRCARFVVMATGCLSAANVPDIEGRDGFGGRTFHTGRWPHEGVDFSGRRVAVIGTGSSAVQSIPFIAAEADRLTVFQRTATWAVPAHNEPLDPAVVAEIKADYAAWRETARDSSSAFGGYYPRREVSALDADDAELAGQFDERWEVGGLSFLRAYNDLLLDEQANATAADYIRSKIAELVHDPGTAALLSPDTIVGCKRLCVDTDYYATYNRPNVRLIDVSSDPVERIDATGIVVDGVVHAVDDIVFATGFDAMTGALDRIAIEGRGGRSLRDAWSAGPLTYLGLQIAGFPNLFTITGPGSPSVLTNMIASIEQHVEWIIDAIETLDAGGMSTIEASDEAQAQWVGHVNEVANHTVFHGCSSWYLGANVPGKPRVFMPLPGFPEYRAVCDEVVADGYRGFVRT